MMYLLFHMYKRVYRVIRYYTSYVLKYLLLIYIAANQQEKILSNKILFNCLIVYFPNIN